MGEAKTKRGFGIRPRIAALVLTAAAAVVGSGLAPSASAAVPVQAAAAAPSATSTGATSCAPAGASATMCTGTYSGDNAWDWSVNYPTGGQESAQPTVTVDQTSGLTNQIVQVSWNNFTPSFNYRNNGNPTPGFQAGQEYYPVAVYQCQGTTPQDFSADCNGLMVGTPTSGAPGTGVEGYTQTGKSTLLTGDCAASPNDTTCGTGYVDLQIQTKLQNSALNCDSSHPCSIVVLPIWGGNTYYSPAVCSDHSDDYPTDPDGNTGQTAMDGSYGALFTPCAWNDRVVVPISFAPTPKQYCASNNYAFSAAGSPLLEKAMGQWQPGWCTASQGKVDFNYDSGVNEYEARTGFLGGGSSLSSSTDVALLTDPASSQQTSGSSKQFTYAPVATTAISISYYVDDAITQEPITNLKLDARLVAKLLTQSYALSLNACQPGQIPESDTCDPAVAGNPSSIFDDPEFYALNPEYTKADFTYDNFGNEGEFYPMVIAGNSDMTYELTRWVASNADARAFLEGEPDQWGMHVNTYYEKGENLPISQFQILDPGYTAPANLFLSTGYPYLSTMQVAWNPVTGIDNIAADLANWTSSSLQFVGQCNSPVTQPPCPAGVSLVNPKQIAEPFPQRALFSVVDSGTAAAYRFPTAELVNPAGNAVGPSIDSMTAAVGSMKTNPDGITQYQNFGSTSADAYPLTEVQYAMVPTCGLSSAKAGAISTFLQDVANSQSYGVGLGQIPPFGGYLALSDAQKAQDLTAASAVQRQTCKSPPPDTTVSGGTPPAADNTGGGTPGLNPSIGTGAGIPNNATVPTATSSTGGFPTGSTTATASAKASPTKIGLGDKAADTSSDMKYVLPIALAAGALLAIGGPLAYGIGTTGGLRRPRLRKLPRLRRRTGSRGPGGGGDIDG